MDEMSGYSAEVREEGAVWITHVRNADKQEGREDRERRAG